MRGEGECSKVLKEKTQAKPRTLNLESLTCNWNWKPSPNLPEFNLLYYMKLISVITSSLNSHGKCSEVKRKCWIWYFLVNATSTQQWPDTKTCLLAFRNHIGVYAYRYGVRISAPKHSSTFSQLAFLNRRVFSKYVTSSELIHNLSPRKREDCYTTDLEKTLQVKTLTWEQLLKTMDWLSF